MTETPTLDDLAAQVAVFKDNIVTVGAEGWEHRRATYLQYALALYAQEGATGLETWLSDARSEEAQAQHAYNHAGKDEDGSATHALGRAQRHVQWIERAMHDMTDQVMER